MKAPTHVGAATSEARSGGSPSHNTNALSCNVLGDCAAKHKRSTSIRGVDLVAVALLGQVSMPELSHSKPFFRIWKGVAVDDALSRNQMRNMSVTEERDAVRCYGDRAL